MSTLKDDPLLRLQASREAIARQLAGPAASGTPPLLAATAQRHPWLLLGGAALAGAALTALLRPSRPGRRTVSPGRPADPRITLLAGPAPVRQGVLLPLLTQLAWQAFAAQRAGLFSRPPAPPAAAGDGTRPAPPHSTRTSAAPAPPGRAP